jgi:hypothetical protein
VLLRKRWRMIKDALDQTYSAEKGAVSSFASVKRPPPSACPARSQVNYSQVFEQKFDIPRCGVVLAGLTIGCITPDLG